MLSDLPTLLVFLRMAPDDTTQTTLLTQLLQVASGAIKLFCKRSLESEVITEYPIEWQLGGPDLPVAQRPIRLQLLTGTLTSGSSIITGLAVNGPYDPANIMVGSPVSITGATPSPNNATLGAIPAFTTILSSTSTTATMSANATASGTFPLCFGLTVFLDFGGYYGAGLNAFQNGPGNSSQLYIARDYAVKIDQPDGTSKCGLLALIGGGGWGGASLGAFLAGGNAWGWGGRRNLSANLPPVWPKYPGCVKVQYVAGLGVGATAPGGTLPANTTLPVELTYCCNTLVAWMRTMTPVGIPVDVSTMAKQVADTLNLETSKSPELGSVRGILVRYREQAT